MLGPRVRRGHGGTPQNLGDAAPITPQPVQRLLPQGIALTARVFLHRNVFVSVFYPGGGRRLQLIFRGLLRYRLNWTKSSFCSWLFPFYSLFFFFFNGKTGAGLLFFLSVRDYFVVFFFFFYTLNQKNLLVFLQLPQRLSGWLASHFFAFPSFPIPFFIIF